MTPVATRDGAIAAVIAYHDRTKHHFNRYARSLGYLDWASQPDPFRRFDGARTYLLPLSDTDPTPPYDELYTGSVASHALSVHSLAVFLEQSLGISASKSHAGSGWKLRCNPSSGNLHPTEGYVIVPALAELHSTAAVYHYVSDDHSLELRGELPQALWQTLVGAFPRGAFLCGLTSIYWREAWKYGERALRYCHHDAGHALGALRLSAASLGWRCVLIDALSDDDRSVLLGVGLAAPAEPVEHEHADLLLAVLTDPIGREVPNSFEREAIEAARNMEWTGTPNRLSQEHVDWEIIEQTAELSRKPRTEPGTRMVEAVDRAGARARPPRNVSAGTLFRQRRSAVAMDGSTSIPREAFYRMLQSTLPSAAAPFDVWPYEPRIHFGLFVHRVDDLAAGLYAFVRSPDRVDEFRNAMRPDLAWTAPEGCPESLPLYALADLDCRTLAAQVSCLQDIAGDGAFSLGMIADFDRPLREHGPWYYPRLYWEAGLVGQVLYLEAEAAGVRSTGIGCYFDDAVHDVFGLRGHAFQSLYHFTVGGAVDDPRITGLPPYSAERRARQGWV